MFDMIFIFLTNVIVVVYLLRFLAVAEVNNYISRYDYATFVDFYKIVVYEDIFTHMLPFVLMLSLLNALRIVNINHNFVMLTSMMHHVLRQLLNVAVWLFVMFTMFVGLTFYLLGSSCYDYNNFSMALMSATSLCDGRPKFAVDVFDVPVIVGQMFVLTSAVCVLCCGCPWYERCASSRAWRPL